MQAVLEPKREAKYSYVHRRALHNSMWYVYILRCKDGSLYTGSTSDLDKRFLQHATKKGAKYTRSKGVLERVYAEAHESRSDALKRESQIKKLRREKKLLLIAAGEK